MSEIDIQQFQREVHLLAISKGWHTSMKSIQARPTPGRNLVMLALIHSEVSECVECVRMGEIEPLEDENGKPVGLPSELADIVIRCMDMAEVNKINLEQAIVNKHTYNKTRTYRHGSKLL